MQISVGLIEISLENLAENIHLLEKVTEEITNLIQYPKDVPCNMGETVKSDITLVDFIKRNNTRVDEVNQRLSIIVNILRDNLGNLKLD